MCGLLPLLLNEGVFGLGRILITGGLQGPLLQAPLDPLCLGLHLLERSALVRGVAFGDTPLLAAGLELRCQLLNVPGKRCGFSFGLGKILFQTSQTAINLAQLALQGKGAFAGRLASGHGAVMKALAPECEEKGVPVLGGHLLWVGRIIDDIAILELAQKRLEGPTEAVQDADRIFQWRNSRATDGVVAPFEKAALGGIVNQEGGASIDARLQQPYALFGSSPTFDHDIVQLIAQELVDHAFVLAADRKSTRLNSSHLGI